MNRPAVRPLVWVVAAVAVTATATALITASLVTNDSVLSPSDVDRALAAATNTPTSTDPSTATVTGGAGDVIETLTPGTVTARCHGDLAALVSWSPNPGWRADDPVRGPAAEVSVRFESDVAADYKITVTCVDGMLLVHQGPDDDDHGRRGHDGGDDHDGDDDGHDDGDNSGPGGGGGY